VLPSVRLPGGRTEGLPAVLLEALAAGAPLVATAVGGIPDVVRHGENGWLCRDNDEAALAAALEHALTAPDAQAQARRARETALRFDWSAVAQRYVEAFGAAAGSVPAT
jgi:glycosyltransferase involved in cell wall biosynthesis